MKYLEKHFKIMVGALLTTLALIVLALVSFPDSQLHIYFLDIGQGDAILVETPKHFKILIDGGPNHKILTDLGKIIPFWDKKIDLIVATHPDSDHINGLTSVLNSYQVGTVWINSVTKDTEAFKNIQAAIDREKVPVYTAIRGDRLDISDGVEVKVLWPKEKAPQFDLVDETSLVVYLTYRGFDTLLTGDALETTQPYPEVAKPLKVYKVPHHGAKNGVNNDYLNLIKPQLAVISAGKNNRYGHPSPVTLDKLKKVGSKIMDTMDLGTIEVVSDGKNWYTRTEK